jgi:hypothetical protein
VANLEQTVSQLENKIGNQDKQIQLINAYTYGYIHTVAKLEQTVSQLENKIGNQDKEIRGDKNALNRAKGAIEKSE